MQIRLSFLVLAISLSWQPDVFSQNALMIPPTLTGASFNLNIQSGTQSFYAGTSTPTYGINGTWMAPTIIVNKGDSITLNVQNGLAVPTTIHWHGLHVAAVNDGGPHQIISPGTTWSPSFRIRNDAGTFWYHPHGDGKTDLQVARGIAGFFIVKDPLEAILNIPRTYGVDDYPLVVQSKAFDILQQIAIATEMDTAVFVNGTLHPYQNMPAQVVRLRLLNGSSMRSYNFGFTANKNFHLIATDGGLIDSSIDLTRIRLSPGERVEILLDLQGMNGQIINLINYGSELANGIYGAASVPGMMGTTIPEYDLNPLNGLDYGVLQINVVAPTSSPTPIITLPTNLVSNIRWASTAVNTNRNFTLSPELMGPSPMLIGPFLINGKKFEMDSINVITYLDNIEKWKWINNTSIAHPIHIHDMHFYILNINGAAVPAWEQGKKDVVLVMPQQYVEFITKFETFADDMTPYMYHCHLLHHEDDGMMGSFIVIDTNASNVSTADLQSQFAVQVYPNPSDIGWKIIGENAEGFTQLSIVNNLGQEIVKENLNNTRILEEYISNEKFSQGLYYLKISTQNSSKLFKLIKN